jgi:hypothetical protein
VNRIDISCLPKKKKNINFYLIGEGVGAQVLKESKDLLACDN